ncbi:transcriptional regulator, SarA/Rot family [uncultured Granulicatella sp.]|uniref:MarR family winged helix-turn-helix transcriptional regulator n=1 Tax=uncultured Granulicatella sp. TaxID=316089 RepID=UPI0028D8448C|nr:winged helix DNA-binding protein [uncultured Granulicatella sp.]
MTNKQIFDDIIKLILRIEHLNVFRSIAPNLTIRENNVLILLYYYDSEFGKTLTIKDISCFYEIKSSTAIQFVNSLEKHGYIVRMNDQNDKRVTLVTLTDLGREVGEIITQKNNELVQKILETQEKEELEQAFQVIHKMINTIESIPIETLSYRKEETK